MTQLASGISQQSDDTIVASEEAKPQYGLDAKFNFDGRKDALDKAAITRIFQTRFQVADNYRLRFIPEWQTAYLQYHGDLRDRGKAEWQSNINIPMPYQAVNAAKSRIVDAIFQNQDFFGIEPYTRGQDSKVAIAKNMVKWQLDKARAREAVETSVADALICGCGPMKVFFETRIEQKSSIVPSMVQIDPDELSWSQKLFARGPQYRTELNFEDQNFVSNHLRLDSLIPTDFWLDPSGRGEFIIQRIKKPLSDIWALARDQKDDSGQIVIPAVYDPIEVAKITIGAKEAQYETQAAVIRRDTPHLTEDEDVELYEFWGDLRDPATGVVLFKNVFFTLAQKQFLIRAPQKNPYRHRKYPFIMFTCEKQPHQIYSYGILRQGAQIQEVINQQVNVVNDRQRLSVPMIEIDPKACRNPDQLMGSNVSVKPGKGFLKANGAGADKPIFTPVRMCDPLNEFDLAWIDRLIGYSQMGSGVTEFATGQTMTNNRKTKEEIQVRSQAVQQTFNSAASHIESDALGPMLKMIYMLALQYESNYSDENLLKMFADDPQSQQMLSEVKGMTTEERWEALYLDGEFKVTGISLSITRQDRLNRMMGFLKVISANPQLAVLMDNVEFLRGLLQNFDLDPKTIVPQALQIAQQVQQASIQQMLNPQPQQGQGAAPQGMPGSNQHNSQQSAQGQMNNAPAEQIP